MSLLDDLLLSYTQGAEEERKRRMELESARARAKALGPIQLEQDIARERAMAPIRTEQDIAHRRALIPVEQEALAQRFPLVFKQKQQEQEAENERTITQEYGTEAGQAYTQSRKPEYQGLPSYPLGPDTPPPPQWEGTAALKLKASPEYQAKTALTQIMAGAGGMQDDLATLKRKRDALRILPIATAQSLADDLQKRIDALEAQPIKQAKETRDIAEHGARMQNYTRLEREGQERAQWRQERLQDLKARRQRLADAASGKKPFTSRELMTDRSGLIRQRQTIEERWDIEDVEKEALLKDVDEEIAWVGKQLKEARRREQAAPQATPGSAPSGEIRLSPAQEAAVQRAPEGHRFRLGGKGYVKRGGQLVPETR